jgi:hypothetical protein
MISADQIAPRSTAKVRALGAFESYALALHQAGYSPIPIVAGSKRPLLKGWSACCDKQLAIADIKETSRKHPNAGLAVACGYGGLVAVDVDTDDPDVYRVLRKVLGEAGVTRRGQKGYASFYRTKDGAAPARQIKSKDGKVLVDILGHGRCCIIPPSVHPCGKPYEWTTTATLLNTPLDRLPLVGEG